MFLIFLPSIWILFSFSLSLRSFIVVYFFRRLLSFLLIFLLRVLKISRLFATELIFEFCSLIHELLFQLLSNPCWNEFFLYLFVPNKLFEYLKGSSIQWFVDLKHSSRYDFLLLINYALVFILRNKVLAKKIAYCTKWHW